MFVSGAELSFISAIYGSDLISSNKRFRFLLTQIKSKPFVSISTAARHRRQAHMFGCISHSPGLHVVVWTLFDLGEIDRKMKVIFKDKAYRKEPCEKWVVGFERRKTNMVYTVWIFNPWVVCGFGGPAGTMFWSLIIVTMRTYSLFGVTEFGWVSKILVTPRDPKWEKKEERK